MQTAPVDARAADALARQERAPAPDRQRHLGGLVAEGDGVDRVVRHQLEALGILHLVADAGEGEVLAGRAVLAALEAHHLQAGLGELARDDRAGPAHSDHHRIDFFQSRDHDSVPPYEKSAIDCGAAT